MQPKRHRAGILLTRKSIAVLLFSFFSVLTAANTELRGIVVRGSDWAYGTTQADKEEALRENFRKAEEQGFNTVFFEIREAAEVFYPSPLETWSSLLNERDPGFDPLKLAVEEALRYQLQIIVYMDILPAFSLVNKPHSPEHASRQHASWLLKDNEQPIVEDIYHYFDPSNPELLSYLKSIIRDIADRYEIDGFYFRGLQYPNDRILNSPDFLRQYERIKDFSKAGPEAYARDMISNCLETMVSEIKLRKPYLLIFTESAPLPFGQKGFEDLKPARTYYFQEGLRWLEEGLIDVLVPQLFMRSRQFRVLYDVYREAAESGHSIIPMLQGHPEIYNDSEIRKSLHYIEKKKGMGAIIYAATAAYENNSLYETESLLPYLMRTHRGSQAVGIDLKDIHVPDAVIRLSRDGRMRMVDSNNFLSLVLPELPRTLRLETMNKVLRYSTREWAVPYRYRALSERELERPEMFVEMRRVPPLMNRDSSYQFLFRASAGDTRINGESVEAYPYTGIFFKWLPFAPYGQGTLVRGSVRNNGDSVYYEDLFFGNVPDTSRPEALIVGSVSPQGSVLLPPNDKLRISFRSDLASQLDTILLYAGRKSFPLWYNGSQFIAEIPTDPFVGTDTVYIKVTALDNTGKSYSYDLPLNLKVLQPDAFPLIETAEDFVPFSYSLGLVRLGGPYLNEYPKGVRFVTDAKFGGDYRVRLNTREVAFVNERYVKVLSGGYPKPEYNITSISAQPDTFVERIVIPWPEPVPYAVFPEPKLSRIRVRLYGVHSNSTWITHRSGLELVDYVTWQQHDAETYDVLVYLNNNNIWGYDLKQNERWLSLEIRRPPSPDSILIALEAGHGGDWNWGAVGLSGMKEKDVNLDVTEKTRDLLTDMGYRVVEIRPGDSAPYLRERWLLTDSLQADVFISIHANAAGGDYLRVSGTSTYYNNPFWRDFAGLTYKNMLELSLNEFGIVGSFNYMMCRMSQRPSILVELAFMSHAEDENKMANPDFRSAMSEKIARSIDEYIKQKLNGTE